MPCLTNMKEFVLGSHVRVIGQIKYAQYLYLWVVRKEDVEFASTTVRKITEVLKGRNMPERIKDKKSPEKIVSIKSIEQY